MYLSEVEWPERRAERCGSWKELERVTDVLCDDGWLVLRIVRHGDGSYSAAFERDGAGW